jgi:hypothetical protein
MNQENPIPHPRSSSATRVVSSTIGALVGIFGMEHGTFEVLQGDAIPSGLVIDAIAPAQKLWPGASEPALTIIPSFFVTGICAIIVGFLVIIWAGRFIHRAYGARILMVLCTLLFLVGGGSPPLFSGIIASITATRIGKPLMWWRAHLSDGLQNILSRSWPWILIIYVIISLFAVEIAVLGYPLIWFLSTDIVYMILWAIGPVSDIPLVIAILAAFAYDIQKQDRVGVMR